MHSRTGWIIVAAIAGTTSPSAYAQSVTTGAVKGRVVDTATKEPLAGVTVVATGASPEPQSALTDEDGSYKITELLPGEYTISFYVGDLTITRNRVRVGANMVTPVFQNIRLTDQPGTIIDVVDVPPQIDPDSTTRGSKYNRDFIEKGVTTGRGFESVAGTQAGTHNDGVGLAVSGSTSLENRYLVDGIDITGLTYGTVGTPILNEFIEEVEMIAGGYNAEWGRAIGGIVNVITRSGSNKLRGSVFGTLTPGLLAKRVQSTPVNASSIDVESNRAYSGDFGVELGGPIIKDRLFFYAGFAPQLARIDYTRITKRQTDCRRLLPDGTLSGCDPRISSQGGHADGSADVDPATGFYITDELDRETRAGTSRQYTALGKLNLAITPKDQAQLTLIAVPSSGESPGLYGLPTSGGRSSGLTTDAAVRWTSKLNSDRTEVEALVAWHRATNNSGSIDPSLDDQPRQILRGGNLGTWSGLGRESARTAAGCSDGGAGDPYTAITNCPMETITYAIGGPGSISRDREDRRMARLTATHRFRALGTHELKGGLDFEADTKETARLYSGGAFIQNEVGSSIRVTRWVQLAPVENKEPRFDQMCTTSDPTGGNGMGGTRTYACDFLSGTPGAPGTSIVGSTVNWAAFLRDSWAIRPNLVFNAGVRYEEQRLRYASNLRGTDDPLTGNRIGKDAMNLDKNFAPRLGLIWDPTRVGASKIFGAWGRFYESIPMDINDRSFGGEVSYAQTFTSGGGRQPCGPTDPRIGAPDGAGCVNPSGPASDEILIGSSGVLVAPGIKAQYMDEVLAGVEYQLAPDLKLGVSYQNRRLGRVIEDVSTDGASTYIIANPGEWSQAEEDKLEERIARTDDATTRTRLERQLALFKGIRGFDPPRRTYEAFELNLARQFSKGFFAQASYTFSRTQGNYPGSLSYDNGQIDPNISSQYDLIELLANRQGKLPQDRPHSIKIDSHYTFDLGEDNAMTVGGRVRMVSGAPTSALGAHYLYGANESFLLPRGVMGRSEVEHGVDVRFAYARKLSRGMKAEVFIDIFNLYDKQGTFNVDQTYAPAFRRSAPGSGSGSQNNVNPIVGGDYEDLMWAKAIDSRGVETDVPTARNPNFGKTTARYAPTSARVGFRLTF